MSIDLIIEFSFLILILFDYILNASINQKLITEQDISDSLFLKFIVLSVYFFLFFSTIMTWKLLWQVVFVLGITIFVIMFVIFGVKGYRDITQLIKKNNE